jgi:hypothetical protein
MVVRKMLHDEEYYGLDCLRPYKYGALRMACTQSFDADMESLADLYNSYTIV